MDSLYELYNIPWTYRNFEITEQMVRQLIDDEGFHREPYVARTTHGHQPHIGVGRNLKTRGYMGEEFYREEAFQMKYRQPLEDDDIFQMLVNDIEMAVDEAIFFCGTDSSVWDGLSDVRKWVLVVLAFTSERHKILTDGHGAYNAEVFYGIGLQEYDKAARWMENYLPQDDRARYKKYVHAMHHDAWEGAEDV